MTGSLLLILGLLPNPEIHPGYTNPDINQSNINQTICNKKWSTSSIRPSWSYTNALKIRHIKQYGYKDTNTSHYEEDHIIPLELGGSPKDPRNLWAQPYSLNGSGATAKDKVENYLHSQVCSGKISLSDAQKSISKDWYSVFLKISTKQK